jgi:hypothetical protein
MNKTYKAASSIGAAALVLSGAAMAAAPADGFNNWSVTGGVITSTSTGGTGTNCPTGFTCTAAVTGDGFFQRQISDASGTYFQTIITDSGVTGAPGSLSFADESFVQTGNVGGLADKSTTSDSSTTGSLTETFSGSTTLLTGWAKGAAGGDVVQISQSISADDTAADAPDFRTDFWLDQVGKEGSVGKLMRLTSQVDIQEDKISGGSVTTPAQVQGFVLVDRKGDKVLAGSAVIGTNTLTWADNENVKAVFVAQDMSQITGVGQEFGYTSYQNVTTPATINQFSLDSGSSSAPIGWDTTAAPTGWGSLATDGTGAPF